MGTKGSIFATQRTVDALNHMTGERHGKPWIASELKDLCRWFMEGKSLQHIIQLSGRSAGGVLPKLREAHLIVSMPAVRPYYPDYAYAVDIDEPTEQPITEVQPIEEPTMTTLANIENKVLIQGQDAANMSDDQIFDLIAKLEAQQARLNNIGTKPKKLTAKIEALSNDIALLVEYVDGR